MMLNMDAAALRERMAATGIGFAGLDGAWWRPARAPFPLPAQVARDLAAIGRALLALFDVVGELYSTLAGEAAGLNALLHEKVPDAIPRLNGPGLVQSLRPDFQLCSQPGGRYRLVATELEMCPSAHGFAHALQAGYGLTPDLVRAFVHYLAGREFWFVGAEPWSEFLIEQLAFCRALAEHGARGRVLYDRPLALLADEFRAGRRWQPPMFGVAAKPAHWNDDLLGRLRARGLLEFAWPGAAWPEEMGDAVIFRFGYFDCFAPEALRQFERWRQRGAALLNPARFYLDSKAVLAAVNVPAVRDRLTRADLVCLDECLPETILVSPASLPRLLAEREAWVLKFAGFDNGQRAWGGRSLQIGAAHTAASWAEAARQYAALPWPTVAQRLTPTDRIDIDYLDQHGQAQTLRQGYTRLRAFLLRTGATGALAAGAHLTVSGGTAQVSEGTDAVQAPILFQ